MTCICVAIGNNFCLPFCAFWRKMFFCPAVNLHVSLMSLIPSCLQQINHSGSFQYMVPVFARRPVHYLMQASVQACRLFSLMLVRTWHKKSYPEPQPFSCDQRQCFCISNVHKVRRSFVRIKINVHPCAYLLLNRQCGFL